jgi:hypothetical protein
MRLIYRKNKNSFRERDERKENPFADYAFSLRWLLGSLRVIEAALENWVASPHVWERCPFALKKIPG